MYQLSFFWNPSIYSVTNSHPFRFFRQTHTHTISRPLSRRNDWRSLSDSQISQKFQPFESGKMPASPEISQPSPSFCSYSNSNLAEIAARVVEEFRAENGNESEFFEDDLFPALESDEKLVDGGGGVGKEENKEDGDEEEEEEEEFEFVTGEAVFSPISADEIFYNGQIRPIYPVFNRNLLAGDVDFEDGYSNSMMKANSNEEQKSSTPPPKIRLPLKKLFIEDRDVQSSCSSSEADEMDGIPPGTYCVWRPKAAAEKSSPRSCKKSNSTGWSKRWKFRDLIHRSNSEGKDSFVFLTPSFKKGTPKLEKPKAAEASNATDKVATPPHCPESEGDKRRSFLPHRHDLVGFFANVNGLSRSLQPF